MMGRWWRSFRWRLALLASGLIALVFLGFATLVDVRLNRAMSQQHETRIRFLLERLPPLPFLLQDFEGGSMGRGGHGPGMGRGRERLRELIGERSWIGFSTTGASPVWYPFVGDWTDSVRQALVQRQESGAWKDLPVFDQLRRAPDPWGPSGWEPAQAPPGPTGAVSGVPRPPPPPMPETLAGPRW